jgi:hypothetical protein
VGFDGVVGDGPGAAMNEKDRIRHGNSSSYMEPSLEMSPVRKRYALTIYICNV